jgi:WhiB family redox-sensing transcriptional regulator
MSHATHQARGLAALARDANPTRRAAVGIRAGFEDPDEPGENWQSRGECAKPGHDAEDWFPFSYTGGPSLAQIDRVRAVCARCPVRERCLDWALTANESDGIWAGTTPDERKALRRRATRRRFHAMAAPQNGPEGDGSDPSGALPANEPAAAQRGAGDAHGPLRRGARDAHSATESPAAVPAASETPKTPSRATEATACREAASDA